MRTEPPEWRHNLQPGEKVSFAKVMGPKSYRAAGVNCLVNYRSMPVGELWEEARPSTPVDFGEREAMTSNPETPVTISTPVTIISSQLP